MPSNRLLSILSRRKYQLLAAACDEVNLGAGDILWEPGRPIRHVYFPQDCSIAQLLPGASRGTFELALIGNEGMLGVPLLLGVNTSILQARLQVAGTALRLTATSFRRELKALPALRQRLQQYAYVLQVQLAQSAACISNHTLDLRLARLLLMTHDRAAGTGGFYVTHRTLAKALGVRRVGVTIAAGQLQKRKLLNYSRGDVTILNRKGLEKAACRCYQDSIDMYQSILG